MRRISHHKRRLIVIGIILSLFILFFIAAPSILRSLFPMPYLQIVEKYATANNLQVTLIYAVIKTESDFNGEAVSPKGAMGLMQITEKTGHWIASRLDVPDFATEDLMDPEMNIRFGCWYLSYLMDRFNGDSELAIAAYNAGEGTVSGWVDSGDIIWKGLKIKSLPFIETEEYLTRVNRLYFVYKTLYPEMDS